MAIYHGQSETLRVLPDSRRCLQGAYRKQRGLVFYTYLLLNHPGLQLQQTAVAVPGCGHNETCILSSAQSLSAWSPQATSGL